jgi:hypothetical protein
MHAAVCPASGVSRGVGARAKNGGGGNSVTSRAREREGESEGGVGGQRRRGEGGGEGEGGGVCVSASTGATTVGGSAPVAIFPNTACRGCGDQVASPRVAGLRATGGTSLARQVRAPEVLVCLVAMPTTRDTPVSALAWFGGCDFP